eukprot:ctg_754.g449
MLSVRIQLWRSTVVRWWEQYLSGGDEGGRGESGDNESAGAVAARKKELVGAPSGQSSGKSRGTVDVESGTAGTAGAMTTGRTPAAPSSSSSAAVKADAEPVASALWAVARQAIRRAWRAIDEAAAVPRNRFGATYSSSAYCARCWWCCGGADCCG